MDKRVLDHDELNYLRHFIKSRGFRDEGTISEILDHFACKVEELLTENPDLQFEKAVREAHYSFGIMGFAEIVAVYEKQLREKYKSIYWSTFKQLLFHPVHPVLLAIIGFFAFKTYLWADSNGFKHVLGYNDFSFLLYLIMICYEIYITRLSPNKNSLIIQIARSQNFLVFFLMLGFIGHVNDHPTHRALMLESVLYGFTTVCFICHFYAKHKAFMLAAKEYNAMKHTGT